ncbi:exported hypothetical protein [Verrucomicrobia bacterium]|nr:exported hypothetical protein [Verrucomicrobiota bacterium]
MNSKRRISVRSASITSLLRFRAQAVHLKLRRSRLDAGPRLGPLQRPGKPLSRNFTMSYLARRPSFDRWAAFRRLFGDGLLGS